MNVSYYSIAAGLTLAIFALWMYLRSVTFAAKLVRAHQQIALGLARDQLTGLLTLYGFDAVLGRWSQKVDRGGGSFTLLYVAVDDFGLINDAYGRESGDALLVEVANRLAKCTGEKTEICHAAPGEFALITNGGIVMGRNATERLKAVFAEVFECDLMQTHLLTSIGMAVYPEHGTRSMLLGNAALAMRKVKRSGGNGICQYEPKMSAEVREQTLLVHDLRMALELGQFELYFQPKIDVISLQITALEALLRWNHPTRGNVSPAVFIPLAEQCGVVGSIGNWVIEEACATAAHWRKGGMRMRVAVNISGCQMKEEDLVDRIEATLKRHGIQPGRFTCEITESVAMEDTKLTKMTFEKMRRAGVHVSIDDFGTGYSSLATLRQLPVSELKIDKSFISDLENSESAQAIVKAIVNMATALNLHIVAEGVETLGQQNLLIDLGCHELQGYLFSVPISAEEIEHLVNSSQHQGDVMFRPSLFQTTAPADFS